MADFDTCKGCSAERQGFSSHNHSFCKRLLVATCLAVIIAMCLTPTEAATLVNKRLQRLENMTLTKDSEIPSMGHRHYKHRHQREHMKTKDSFGSRRPRNELEEAMFKIINKLRSTIRDFDQHKFDLNESKEYRDTKIKLPTTNFMQVRFHNYKNMSKEGTTLHDITIKFSYVMPKLYKSLKKYHEIFKILADFEIKPSDYEFTKYQTKRRGFFRETIRNLHGTITLILDGLNTSHTKVPHLNKNLMHLTDFKEPRNAAENLTYDGTVVRGYSMILNRWFCLLTSKDIWTKREQHLCKKLDMKMKEKRQLRKQKTKKRVAA